MHVRKQGIFLSLLVLTLFLPVISLAQKATFSGKVVGVMDGDTIEVMHGGKPERIRLNGIDCPEKGQAFGNRAKQFTSELAFGKDVMVEVLDHDRYGRSVGQVILPDGRDLNRELLKAGLAWWYRQYSSDTQLQRLEDQARQSRQGLWSDPNPIPPWEWRHGSTSKNSETKKELGKPADKNAPQVESKEGDETVYVTRTGTKYHRAGCRYLSKSSIPISLKEAESRYSPCSVCNPPRIRP